MTVASNELRGPRSSNERERVVLWAILAGGRALVWVGANVGDSDLAQATAEAERPASTTRVERALPSPEDTAETMSEVTEIAADEDVRGPSGQPFRAVVRTAHGDASQGYCVSITGGGEMCVGGDVSSGGSFVPVLHSEAPLPVVVVQVPMRAAILHATSPDGATSEHRITRPFGQGHLGFAAFLVDASRPEFTYEAVDASGDAVARSHWSPRL